MPRLNATAYRVAIHTVVWPSYLLLQVTVLSRFDNRYGETLPRSCHSGPVSSYLRI